MRVREARGEDFGVVTRLLEELGRAEVTAETRGTVARGNRLALRQLTSWST